MSRKRVNKFELTLAHSEETDQKYVFYALDNITKRLLVVTEKHSDGSPHIHAFVDVEEKHTIKTFREIIVPIIGVESPYKGSIHLSAVRNEKSWIKYITKEAVVVESKGIDESLYHFSWKMVNYIQTNRSFSYCAGFIRQHPNYARIIHSAHTEYWGSRAFDEFGSACRAVEPDVTVEWVTEASGVLNNGGHVLIFGESGVGKSVFVDDFLIKNDLLRYTCKLPCSLRDFEFSEINSQHKIVHCDDICEEYIRKHRQVLLQLLDRKIITIDPKCKELKTLYFTGTLIFCSNYLPLLDSALARRIHVIHASKKGFQERKENLPEETGVQEAEEESILPT